MTTPLTLTRPAKIHCLARFFGVSGCARSNQSNRGMTTRLKDCGMAKIMGQRPGAYQPGPTAHPMPAAHLESFSALTAPPSQPRKAVAVRYGFVDLWVLHEVTDRIPVI